MNQTTEQAREEVKSLAKSIISTTFLVIAVVSSVFAIIFSQKEVALGIIAGGLLSIINFFFMSRNAMKLLDISDEKKGKRTTIGEFFLRYVFLIFALLFLFSSTNVNIIATLISLFSIQVIIYITNFWQIKFQGNSDDN